MSRRQRRYENRQKERSKNKVEYKYEEVFTFDNLYSASRKCLKNVRWKGTSQYHEIFEVTEVAKLNKQLGDKTYKQHKFHIFHLNERGKKRLIQASIINDRVVQKCLCDNCLNPLLERRLIYDNGASLKGKGITFSRNRVYKHFKDFVIRNNNEGYVLVFDFKSYFASIDHKILQDMIKKLLSDVYLIKLFNQLVDDFQGTYGIGLGSQLCQICAIYYLNSLDHYIKEIFKIKEYARYMDDAYLFNKSKEKILTILKYIYLKCDELKVNLSKNKTLILPINKGFIFLKRKYIKKNKFLIIPCKAIIKRGRRKLNRLYKLSKVNKKVTWQTIDDSFRASTSSLKGTKCYHIIENTKKMLLRLKEKDKC